MERVTLRLPSDVIAAYDAAEGNRSALMRRRLSEAVAQGELSGVPDDLVALAERETAVDQGRLSRKRGTFKQRMHNHFRDKWVNGAVTPSDAEDLAESWLTEAALYGREHLAFAEALIAFYKEAWEPRAFDRPGWPEPAEFMARAEPDDVEVKEALIDKLEQAQERGIPRADAAQRLRKFHPDDVVDAATAEVYGAGGESA